MKKDSTSRINEIFILALLTLFFIMGLALGVANMHVGLERQIKDQQREIQALKGEFILWRSRALLDEKLIEALIYDKKAN